MTDFKTCLYCVFVQHFGKPVKVWMRAEIIEEIPNGYFIRSHPFNKDGYDQMAVEKENVIVLEL